MANSKSPAHRGELIPQIVVSACQGHLGKTTVSIGLCAAWAELGLVVQPFKKGADYIDPSWLTAAANRPCRNLDAFLISEENILLSFQRACQGADLALMEGVMGLYDSFDTGGEGSTAWVARLLGAPVILLINASRMTRSVAAMIMGYQHFEPDTRVAGVILNNVSLSGHKRKLMAAIERYCNIPVLGSMPSDNSLAINEQHLGLRPYMAAEDGTSIIERVRDSIKTYLDLDAILAIAQESKATRIPMASEPETKIHLVQIGVMLDKVFNFYYPENLEALRQAGANLVFIDSLQNRGLPDIDGLYIGGGFPELFPKELEANRGLRQDVAQAIEDGLPVYAECAGLMYLCRGIRWHGEWYEMVGVIPSEVEICPQTQGHGYVAAEVTRENPWMPVGLTVRGHQFHHSRLSNPDALEFAYHMKQRREHDPEVDGIVYKNLFAAYTHLHAFSVPLWAEAFVSLALRERKHRPSLSTLTI